MDIRLNEMGQRKTLGKWRMAGIAVVLSAVALAMPIALSAAPVPSGEDLLSHQAVYKLSLGSRSKASAPSHVEGLMAYSFQDVCDGWSIENKLVMDLSYEESEAIRLDWHFTSWEAKDGRQFRFTVEQKHNGQTTEKLNGVANLNGDGGKAGGWAKFSGTKDEEKALPPGTLFPTAHLLAALGAAGEGEKAMFRPLFDGGGVENPYETTVFISHAGKYAGREGPKAPVAWSKFEDLKLDVEAWRFRMAFSSIASTDALPTFEMDVDYREDGVAGRIVQEFGDFSLMMRPEAIQPLAATGC